MKYGKAKTGKRFECCDGDVIRASREDIDTEREETLYQGWGNRSLKITLHPGQMIELVKHGSASMCSVCEVVER